MSRRGRPWLIGWAAAKANAAPAFVLQSVMLAILLAYYFHPPSAALLNALADFKQRHGLTFVLIASVIVGAVLPELFGIVFFQRGRIRLQNARIFVFNAPFWAFDGFLVNLMYRALAEWLGDRASVPIVAAKICLDQFGYNPFFAAPFGVWGYAWKNAGYSFAKLRPLLTWQYYREHAFPVLVATWAVWIPLMAVFFFLPLGPPFSLFSPSPSFLVLMITYMTNPLSGPNETHARLPLLLAAGDGRDREL